MDLGDRLLPVTSERNSTVVDIEGGRWLMDADFVNIDVVFL
jgi:hypothetical protein